MSQTKVLRIACFLLGFMSASVMAQDTTPSYKKPAPVSWKEETEPQNEVEQQLAAAAKRGEIVLGSCIDGCGEVPNDQLPPGFERGRAVNLPQPRYSSLARAARVSGTVQVQVVIDVDGKVIAAVALDGHPLVRPASLQAARDSTFTPTKWEGQPVKVVGVIHYNFVAQ